MRLRHTRIHLKRAPELVEGFRIPRLFVVSLADHEMHFWCVGTMLQHPREDSTASRRITTAQKRHACGIEKPRVIGQLIQDRTEYLSTLGELVRHVIAETEHLTNARIIRCPASLTLERTAGLVLALGAKSRRGPVLIHRVSGRSQTHRCRNL